MLVWCLGEGRLVLMPCKHALYPGFITITHLMEPEYVYCNVLSCAPQDVVRLVGSNLSAIQVLKVGICTVDSVLEMLEVVVYS